MTEIQILWRTLLDADDAWSACLRTCFGADACNRRYDIDKSDHPEIARTAHAALGVAQTAFENAGGWNKFTHG